jgi:hypothetical protein
MTRSDRQIAPNRVAVNCADTTTLSGNSILLCEIGVNSHVQPGLFVWCKKCRKAHTLTLAQMFQTLREITSQNEAMKQAYVAVLNKAILDLQDTQLTTGQDTSTSKTSML